MEDVIIFKASINQVIPKSRAFTSRTRDLPCDGLVQRDPSLRPKTGCAQDDADNWSDSVSDDGN